MANFNTVRTCVTSITGTALRGYIAGLTLSTAGSSTTFGISSGVATDSTVVSSMNLASAYTKTTASWAVGSTAGCLDTGTIANNTWYSVFLIQRTDTGVVDVLCSTSATLPTLPSPYTLFRRIGSIRTNGSAQWTQFTQVGDNFLWAGGSPFIDVTPAATTGSLTSVGLTVPPGVVVQALVSISVYNSSANFYSGVYSPDQSSFILGASTATLSGVLGAGVQLSSQTYVRTNTTRQIYYAASSGSVLGLSTWGWIDTRGKDN
jgi:hypothetical protein